MKAETVAHALASHPFVHGLSAKHVAMLAEAASIAEFAENEFIFRGHEEARAFYLIISGNVALKIHVPSVGPVAIQTISAGQALGWSWLIPPYQWQFDARAFSPVTALVFDAERVRRILSENPELGFHVVLRINRVLAERLQATRLQLLDVYQTAT